MPRTQARVKPMDAHHYPRLQPDIWYGVTPIFPGVTQRMVNLAGERLARLETPPDYTTVKAEHFEFRQWEDEA